LKSILFVNSYYFKFLNF